MHLPRKRCCCMACHMTSLNWSCRFSGHYAQPHTLAAWHMIPTLSSWDQCLQRALCRSGTWPMAKLRMPKREWPPRHVVLLNPAIIVSVCSQSSTNQQCMGTAGHLAPSVFGQSRDCYTAQHAFDIVSPQDDLVLSASYAMQLS